MFKRMQIYDSITMKCLAQVAMPKADERMLQAVLCYVGAGN